MIIDTHCHLDYNEYDNLDEVIKKMENNILIVSGVGRDSNKEAIDLCQKYNNVFCTIGVHPTEVENNDDSDLKFIEDNILNSKVVGIGEIGLDYYWVKDNKEKQKEWFKKQINLAKKYDKPIVVHSRDSIEDTYNIIRESNVKRVDIHCFSSSLEMAKKFINIGARIGIGGVLTFKNSEKLKEVVSQIDLKHILLETDSPYLTPEPLRGKRNEPYNVYYVAEKIAQIKNISVEEVIKITTDNAIDQFDLKKYL